MTDWQTMAKEFGADPVGWSMCLQVRGRGLLPATVLECRGRFVRIQADELGELEFDLADAQCSEEVAVYQPHLEVLRACYRVRTGKRIKVRVRDRRQQELPMLDQLAMADMKGVPSVCTRCGRRAATGGTDPRCDWHLTDNLPANVRRYARSSTR